MIERRVGGTNGCSGSLFPLAWEAFWTHACGFWQRRGNKKVWWNLTIFSWILVFRSNLPLLDSSLLSHLGLSLSNRNQNLSPTYPSFMYAQPHPSPYTPPAPLGPTLPTQPAYGVAPTPPVVLQPPPAPPVLQPTAAAFAPPPPGATGPSFSFAQPPEATSGKRKVFL